MHVNCNKVQINCFSDLMAKSVLGLALLVAALVD